MQWLTAREDYHRLLTQIALTGMRNGSAVSHFYNYVNFRAETQAAAVLDACALATKVSSLQACCKLWFRIHGDFEYMSTTM